MALASASMPSNPGLFPASSSPGKGPLFSTSSASCILGEGGGEMIKLDHVRGREKVTTKLHVPTSTHAEAQYKSHDGHVTVM